MRLKIGSKLARQPSTDRKLSLTPLTKKGTFSVRKPIRKKIIWNSNDKSSFKIEVDDYGRGILPDGRESLKSLLFGRRSTTLANLWWKEVLTPETYPLIVIVAVAGTLFIGTGTRLLLLNPDLCLTRKSRKTLVWEKENLESKAKKWSNFSTRMAKRAIPGGNMERYKRSNDFQSINYKFA